MPASGDRLADRYVIGPLLGSGGTATVHLAHDERLDRDVAIKVLLPNLAGDPVLARRFEREARAMAAVGDPGLVAVHDVDPGDPVAGRDPFVVMELCPGGSLADRLGVGRPMDPDALMSVLVAVSSALDTLHRAGLVHRDVKPSNILFTADRVKLGDFGLVRSGSGSEPADLTDPGTAVGTLAYLAPERLRGDAGGPPADVYALGTIAHLGLTGAMPRPTGSLRDVVAAAPFRPPAVSTVAPGLGREFDEAVLGALAVDPGRRPDALAFGASLAAALGRWSRSGRPGAATAASAVMASGAAATFGRPQSFGERDESTITALDLEPTSTLELAATGKPTIGLSDPARVERRPSGRLAIAGLVVALVLAVGAAALALPSLLGGSAAPAPSPPVLGGASLSASPLPSTSPVEASPAASASPSPSPSTRPSPTADPAIAALDNIDAAISAARGGPDGLKGKEANELASMAARVRQDLDTGDRAAALGDARELDRRVRAAAENLDEGRAGQLTQASAALVRALGG